MNKIRREFITVFLALAMVMSLGLVVAFGADSNNGNDDSNEVIVAIKGNFSYEDKDKVLKEINRIRWEACKEHLIIDGYPNGLKESDYRPMKWSYELETIAKVRAAEASVYMEHKRLNGAYCFDVISENGMQATGENLSWSFFGVHSEDLSAAIKNFYSEKNYVEKGTRYFDDRAVKRRDFPEGERFQLGHYVAMINPANTYTGMAAFVNPSNDNYITSCAMEFYYEDEYMDYYPEIKKLIQNDNRAITKDKYEEVLVPFNPSYNAFKNGKLRVNGGGMIKPGKTTQLKVDELSYSYGNPNGFINNVTLEVKNASPKWKSGNTSIATVNSNGVVTGKNTGKKSTTITATLGNFKGVTTVGPGTWKKTNGKWWYSYGGSYAKNETIEIDGNMYSFDENGYMLTGWNCKNDIWRYYNKSNEGLEGAMANNTWKKINGKWYYFYKDGKMAASTTVDGYYVDYKGQWIPSGWNKTGGRYWYVYNNGGYARNQFKTINGNYYYFDKDGWMNTGWIYSKGTWYYANKKGDGVEGAIVKNTWKKISGKWYYFYKDGKMAASTTVNGYYVNYKGQWIPAGWNKTGGRYWYAYNNGGYARNQFKTINGNDYYFDKDGWMSTGWIYSNGSWYYANKRGEGVEGAIVKNTWKKINGKWYYFYKDGKMAASTTVNGYYVNYKGQWIPSSWNKTDGRYWYVYNNGGYARDRFETINRNLYSFDEKGWMNTGWIYSNGSWYYANKSGEGIEGAIVKNTWKKISGRWYYFYKDGKMASNTTIGKWYVNKSGAWTAA